MCRVTMGHLRVTVGHLWVTIGHPMVTIGYFFSELHPKVRQTCIIYLGHQNRSYRIRVVSGTRTDIVPCVRQQQEHNNTNNTSTATSVVLV